MSRPAPPTSEPVDVCVAGAGIVGLYNALQYAKRGLSVLLVDEVTERQRADFKVGESLLVFANAFLRTVGDLDDELSASFVKQGFFMIHGMEGRERFDEHASEWGFLAKLPDRWRSAVRSQKLVRAMAGDVQIVRPEVEEALRAKVAAQPLIRVVDRGLVREVELGDGEAPHRVAWRSRDGSLSGAAEARWIVDCSGRNRLLARRFGHDVPLTDGFRTAAAWGQFRGCADDVFDERWEYGFRDGQVIRRDLDTVHLWGDGYWIWLIRLTEGRFSVGITVDRSRHPAHGNLRELFWEVIRRYPVLDFLRPEDLLQFHAYKDVQYLTDTYVSPRRYAIAGDAASIIDALYSQGLSLSFSTSWHAANIAEEHLRTGRLDHDYVERVNRAALADWRLMRSAAQYKYQPAIADSRFFILDHLLDYCLLSASLLTRYRLARLLVETGGGPDRPDRDHRRLDRKLRRTLFLTQCVPWHVLDPARVARIAERWHAGLARRAEWRLRHGVRLPATKAVLRADAAIPAIWRMPWLRRLRRADLTPGVLREPGFVRVKGTEISPPLLLSAGLVMLLVNLVCLGYDVTDTALRRLGHGLRRLLRRTPQVPDTPGVSAQPEPEPVTAPGR